MIIWGYITPYQNLTTEFTHKHQDKLGFIAWYNDSNQLHRDDDEPTIIYSDGAKHWYQNGLLHRDNDKPAIIYANGTKDWWINGGFIKSEHSTNPFFYLFNKKNIK